MGVRYMQPEVDAEGRLWPHQKALREIRDHLPKTFAAGQITSEQIDVIVITMERLGYVIFDRPD